MRVKPKLVAKFAAAALIAAAVNVSFFYLVHLITPAADYVRDNHLTFAPLRQAKSNSIIVTSTRKPGNSGEVIWMYKPQ